MLPFFAFADYDRERDNADGMICANFFFGKIEVGFDYNNKAAI